MSDAFDVVVAGAGPAGSIAALTLAREGARVALVEQRRFPRDKVCGDALIPDSLALLDEVGLLERVRAAGHTPEAVRVTSPGGHSVRLTAPLVTIRRERFDEILASAAVEHGATLREGARVTGPIRDDRGAVAGAAVEIDGRPSEIRAPVTILATGAASKMLDAFGVCRRSTPSALAIRGYYRIPNLDPTELVISYERPVMPGYGWVFPMGPTEANVGCGVFLEHGRPPENLRRLLDWFVAECREVRALMAGAEPIGRLEGAPLRCSLEGLTEIADGLMVTGEAIGTTYSLSGEGIGKAMVSGQLAARAAMKALAKGRFDAGTLGAYAEAMERASFQERFGQYRSAQRWVNHPFVVDLVTRRAQKSARVRRLIEGMLREEVAPSELFSLFGIVRSLVS